MVHGHVSEEGEEDVQQDPAGSAQVHWSLNGKSRDLASRECPGFILL